MALRFTVIQHPFRKKHSLTLHEYILCDMVYFLSTGDKGPVRDWCIMNKSNIADEIGVSERSVFNMIEAMIEKGFLERHSQTKYLKTTVKWQQVYFYEKSTFADTMQNLQSQTANSAVEQTANFAAYNNIIHNNTNTVIQGENSPLPTKPIKTAVQTNTEEPAAPTAEETAFNNFKAWIKKNAANVEKMKEPFTISDYRNLKEKKFEAAEIQRLLMEMHNWKPLLSKNISAYLTLIKWKNQREK